MNGFMCDYCNNNSTRFAVKDKSNSHAWTSAKPAHAISTVGMRGTYRANLTGSKTFPTTLIVLVFFIQPLGPLYPKLQYTNRLSNAIYFHGVSIELRVAEQSCSNAVAVDSSIPFKPEAEKVVDGVFFHWMELDALLRRGVHEARFDVLFHVEFLKTIRMSFRLGFGWWRYFPLTVCL